MVREATITQEEVNAVADSIRAAGGKPTARAVREHLGQGSMATVLRLLQVWQAGQGRAAATPVVLPPALQRAVEFIGKEVASATLLLEQELESAQQSQKDLIAENETQLAAIEGLQTTLDELSAAHSQLEGRSAQLAADLEEARQSAETQRQAAEAARTETAKLQLRLEGVPRLEAELAKLKEALETERTARVAADQAAAVATARLEQNEASMEDLRGRLTRAETDLRHATQESRELRDQASKLQGVLDSTTKELVLAREEARKAEAEATELKGLLASATAPAAIPKT